jgi:hypothetical protein
MAGLREVPWGKIALFGLVAVLMTSSSTIIPEKWALARNLHPQAQARFLKLLEAIEARGYRVELTSSYRLGGNDYHGFGLALDLNIIHLATGQRYGMSVGKTKKADWEATGVPALIRSMGFRWGGDFTTPWMHQGVLHAAYDPVHVDLGKVYDITKLRAAALSLAGSAAALVNFDRRKVALAA